MQFTKEQSKAFNTFLHHLEERVKAVKKFAEQGRIREAQELFRDVLLDRDNIDNNRPMMHIVKDFARGDRAQDRDAELQLRKHRLHVLDLAIAEMRKVLPK